MPTQRRPFHRCPVLCGLCAVLAAAPLASAADEKPADSPNPLLSERRRVPLTLHSPTNVAVGRLGDDVRLCVQGTFRAPGSLHRAAGVEVLSRDGGLAWRHQHRARDGEELAGAYVHWISGRDLPEPAVIYSFVPAAGEKPGGALLLRARDGVAMGALENSSRFGNNNSTIADLDGDGRTELLYPDLNSLTCYALPSAERRWRWDEGVRFCWSLPALVDLDGDGRSEIVFGSEYNNRDHTSSMFALDCQGRLLWRSDGHAEDLGSTPVLPADVDGDGALDLLKVGLDLEHRQNQTWNHLHVFDLRGRLQRKIELGFTGIAIGDMDGDGRLEGVGLSNTRDGGSNGRREIRCLDLATGAVKWTVPVPRAYLDLNSPLMADLSGTGRLHAVVGTGNPAGYARQSNSEPWGDLYVVDATGRIAQHASLPGWPVNLAFCDIDPAAGPGRGKHREELILVLDGLPGSLAVYDTAAPSTRSDWPTAFGNPGRTGTMLIREPGGK